MYDTDAEREFVPKKYCKCLGQDGKRKSLLYKEDGGRHEIGEEYCAYCGHVSWQTYVRRHMGIKKTKNYYR